MRAVKLPSASALPRAFACEASEALPHIAEAATADSSKGDAVHAYLLAIGKGTAAAEALQAAPEEQRSACAAIDLDALPTGGELELALAWNPDRRQGRVLGHDIRRAYEQAGANRLEEFVGSFDRAGVAAAGRGVLVDYKSGWQTASAQGSWQLKAGAVFLADTYQLQEVEAAHLILREGMVPKWDTAHFDSLDLDGFREELRQLADRLRNQLWRLVQQADGTMRSEEVPLIPREGNWCRYCPSWKACPAKTATLRALSQDPLVLLGEKALTEDRAREAVFTLERYEEAAKRAWAELEAYAAVYPIDLGDGRTMRLAPGRETERVKDSQRTYAILAELTDETIALRAMSMSKKGIASAVGVWAKLNGKPVGKTQALILDRLREAGMIEREAGEEKVRIVEER